MSNPPADDRDLMRQVRAERDRLVRHLDEAHATIRRQQETIDRLVAQQENWQVLLRDAQAELRALHAPLQPQLLGSAVRPPAAAPAEPPPAGKEAPQSAEPLADDHGTPTAAPLPIPAQAPEPGAALEAMSDASAIPAEPVHDSRADKPFALSPGVEPPAPSTGPDEPRAEVVPPASSPALASELAGLAAWAPGSGRRSRRQRQKRQRRS